MTFLGLFIFLSLFLFFFSILGMALVGRNIILLLVCLEIMFLAVNINFVSFSSILDDFYGQLFTLYVLAIAGAEAAIGLAIVIAYYRLHKVITLDLISSLKG